MTEPLLTAPPPDEDEEDVPNDDAGDDPAIDEADTGGEG